MNLPVKDIYIFLLNSFKNAQYVNLAVIAFLYTIFSLIVGLSFLFVDHREFASQLVVGIAKHFYDINSSEHVTFNINGNGFLNYYLLFLSVLGVSQEIVLGWIKFAFKKDLRSAIEKSEKWMLLAFAATMLVLVSIASILINQWWLSLIAVGIFIWFVLSYFWYQLAVKIANKIIAKITTDSPAHSPFG